MEQEKGFIAGIDLGSSNIVGLLGRKNEHGVVSILASESIPSDSCINHGVIYNIDEAAGKVKQLINKLENRIGKKIGKTYVSLSGMSLKSVEDREAPKEKFKSEMPITESLLKQLQQQANDKRLSDLTIYSIQPCGVYLDGKLAGEEKDAQEKTATSIESHFQLIAGRPAIRNSLQKCIADRNKIEIAGYIVGAVASAAGLLAREEQNAGCALVDFGGGTTTVSIYKNGFLRYLATIPIGGKTITKDVQAFLNFDENDAEKYKTAYGRVGKKTGAEPQAADSPIKNMREFNRVIQLRQEEIILNVIRRIEDSGYGDQLDAGIFITGGASKLSGLPEFLEEKAKMKVQPATVKRIYTNNANLQNPIYSQCAGLLFLGAEDCEKVEKPPVVPPISEPQGTVVEDGRKDKKGERDKPKPHKPTIMERIGRLFDEVKTEE
jgi:cell division protein FtsA